MDELEVDEVPEASDSGPPESAASEPEEAAAEPAAPEPEEPAPEEAAAEQWPGELEPEEPLGEPVESGAISGETVQNLIGALDNLNETIAGAMPEEEPEELPTEGEGSGSGAEEEVVETSSVDLAPVVQVLERTTELLEQQNDVLVTQHNDLLQVQANLDCVFLAVCMLAGVLIGCFISQVLHDLWRA